MGNAQRLKLAIAATPGARTTEAAGAYGDALRVRLAAPPVDGKANRELAETLADAFGLPKSAVSFKGGETSKTKRLLLRGISSEAVRAVVEG